MNAAGVNVAGVNVAGANAAGPVVVGFTPKAPAAVLVEALALAKAFAVPVVVVCCDPSRVVEGVREDGSLIVAPVDSDTGALVDDAPAPQVAQVETRVGDLVREFAGDHGTGAPDVEVRGALGEPAAVLAQLATELQARFVVVGGQAAGWRSSLHHLMEGSVALHLSTHQSAPVVVVPARG